MTSSMPCEKKQQLQQYITLRYNYIGEFQERVVGIPRSAFNLV